MRISRVVTALAVVVAVVPVVFWPAEGLAQDGEGSVEEPVVDEAHDARLQEARSLFERGIALTDSERWAEALEYFRRSRAIYERPSTVFNMAVALFRLGRYQEALGAFEDYLRLSSSEEDPDRQAEARRYLEQMETSLGRLVLTISPADAQVSVDGAVVEGSGERRQLHLDPGSRNITISAEGHRTRRLSLSVLEGQVHRRSIVLPTMRDGTTLGVTANVDDAIILIDGVEVGVGSADVNVEAGTHEVEISAEGYESYSEDVEVRAGANHVIDAALRREGDAGGFFSSPWPWVIVGAVVAVAVAVTVGVVVAGNQDPLADYNGTTGVVLEGLSW